MLPDKGVPVGPVAPGSGLSCRAGRGRWLTEWQEHGWERWRGRAQPPGSPGMQKGYKPGNSCAAQRSACLSRPELDRPRRQGPRLCRLCSLCLVFSCPACRGLPPPPPPQEERRRCEHGGACHRHRHRHRGCRHAAAAAAAARAGVIVHGQRREAQHVCRGAEGELGAQRDRGAQFWVAGGHDHVPQRGQLQPGGRDRPCEVVVGQHPAASSGVVGAGR